MFSQLGPLFKTTLRQAESADTRLEIRREEKENPGKKRDEQDAADNTGDLWEDSTSVSVEALRTFLIEFLKGRGEDVPEARVSAAEENIYAGITPPPPLRPASPMAAKAVKAYASTAGQNHHPAPPPVMPEQTEETVDLADLLKADELRTIHALIHELDLLSRKGVQTLTIEKAETFLESLVQAVRLEKAKG